MRDSIVQKIQTYLGAQALYKDSSSTNNLFVGRNLPSFVKDYLLKRYAKGEDIDRAELTRFLDTVMPTGDIRSKLIAGDIVTLLTRFTINVDLVHGIRRFGIADLGIKQKEGQIPDHIAEKYPNELVDGEIWGIIKICLQPDDDGKKNHVEMIDFKPFKPYKSVDVNFFKEVRKYFTTEEWIDLLISSIEYEPDGFESFHQKLEFLTRLLIFVEPKLNVVELAPKGTGKSYVFLNVSKYGWLQGGGKITRAKLFYDISKDQMGMLKNHDFVAFDEIQTIILQDPFELRGALKTYLEAGKTTIGNKEFTSECGLMLMGNIQLNEFRRPVASKYFEELPETFRESALLDRFHCFIEGWYLPRIDKSMIYKGWTMNVEYFSEVMHGLRTQTQYGDLFDQLVEFNSKLSMRDFNAVKRIATAYMKLFFPHWTTVEDVNISEFDTFCLQPAIHRRGIINQQLHLIDPEYSSMSPEIWLKNI